MNKNLDSDMQALVDQLAKFKAPPIESLDYGNARNAPTFKNAVEETASHSATVRTMNVASSVLPEQVEKVEHILIPTREGKGVLARVYYPNTNKDLPVIVYFHGGGWVIANLDVYESSCRALCNAAEAIVVSVAYRQAPEAKYPAAVNDAYDSTQWVLQNASSLGGDPNRVVIAGESAGGNLATVTCLSAKTNGGQQPVAQLLVYPVTDMSSNSYPSYAENEDTQPLHTAMLPWFYGYYIDEEKRYEPTASPLLADDLSGLPPAIIITAEFDPLRDEGEAYAKKLADAGVSIKFQRFDGVVHEFFGLAGAVGKAKDAVKFAAEGLKEVFDRTEKANTVP